MNLLNNRYRVIRELGAGGFGNTYLAEDTQMPSSKKCVIKELKPIHNNTQIYQLVQQRFQREAAILEDLGDGCPQIPNLYAYFTDNQQFYLIQQWIEGKTISQIVREQGTLSESTVRDILVNLLPVLDYVHSHRMIHRDIKPDNIMIRLQDNLPVLIDFGAVRETMGTSLNSQGVTTTSIVIGTPGYMPGEQAAGKPVYSSDLYSLGLTAIYALTGRHPQELEVDHATGEFIWRQYASHLNPGLVDVLDKAVRGYPRDRFPTANDMLQALQNQGANNSQTQALSPPPGVPSPAPKNYPTAQPSPVPIYSPPVEPFRNVNTTPPNRSNAVIVGGLIGGGLLAAGVVMAIALKPPAPTNSSDRPTPGFNSSDSSPSVTPIVVNSPVSVPVSSPPPVIVNSPPPVIVDSPPPAIVNSPPRNDLASEAGVDYSKLENLLASGEWNEADKETANLMVAIANPRNRKYLDGDSARRISCTDLNTIDRLWRNYSNGKFGFSVQKNIWNQVGQNKAEFVRYIGWYIADRKFKREDLSFNSQAPIGHLPWIQVLKHEEFFTGDRCF
ncbi:serine/threonine-protein kinase [Merismopedia glauca]|uniref:serine/threonine-protein kinase n=1 Tax=Merismopedia glauca TaxID=292586 RepID=UPI0015E72A22|nr:serine/threonine-protein kinase [Merismopedia glauca]